MESGLFKCKNCGANIETNKALNGVIECEYCFSKFIVPKKDISPAALSFLRQGEHNLDTCKFDDAYSAYAKAMQYDSKEPESYWGMALAEFKVQYIKDTKENRLQPICHEFSDKYFKQNKNFLSALKYATDDQKEEYEKKGDEIDYIRSEFLKLKQSGLDYDCFICVKVSQIDSEQSDISKKNWTDDAYDADAIYDLLKRNGFTPFFSEREIRDRTGVDYEAMILYALYTSETMLVVCRNEEYLNTKWVKNEFTRFKELINNEEKENDSITIVYNGIPIEKLPGNNHGKIQGIDYSRREADFEIVKFVENHTPIARAKKEEEKRKKDNETYLIRQQIEAQKQAQQKLEERLKEINSNNSKGESSTIKNLMTRANQEMEAKNFTTASKILETVLDQSPENAYAWWGLFLCDYGINAIKIDRFKYNTLLVKKLLNNYHLKNATKYADEDLKNEIKNLYSIIREGIENQIKESQNTILKIQTEIAEINQEIARCKKKKVLKTILIPLPLGIFFAIAAWAGNSASYEIGELIRFSFIAFAVGYLIVFIFCLLVKIKFIRYLLSNVAIFENYFDNVMDTSDWIEIRNSRKAEIETINKKILDQNNQIKMLLFSEKHIDSKNKVREINN